ncbi:dual specificity mitogen-activated protein kinase kinase 6-like [Haliotis rufescens]|uniref:dual specificity mitogen-activated protein kinase kinase 6-like n=1 Tax=Haliotis rufescens TaxID=6454 RepID=UPI00201F50CC|nr:dual specificity mitogen-activated protein kinase kinase 6-like [Haliotis rufescens]
MQDDGQNSQKGKIRRCLRLPIQPPQEVIPVDLETEGTLTLGGERVPCDAGDLEHLSSLGQGDSGDVDYMLHRPSGIPVVVKRILVRMDREEISELLQDIETIRSCGPCHDIVSIYGAFFRDRHVWVCMEPMDTSLDKFQKTVYNRGDRIPETALAKIAQPVIQGLDFLYQKVKVTQRDLKPADILLNSKGEVKLGDFGVRYTQRGAMARPRDNGRCPYMAPDRIDPPEPDPGEITPNTIHTERCSRLSVTDPRADVWSLGIILVEMATGEYPYSDYGPQFELLVKIVEQDPPRLTSGEFSSEFEDFVSACLKKNYRERATFEQLLSHPFIEGGSGGIDMAAYLNSYGELAKC